MERVCNGRGKRAISVRAIEVLLSRNFIDSPSQAEDQVTESYASIFNDGTTGYTADKSMQVYCTTPEPFNVNDIVECNVVVGSWNYDATEMNLEVNLNVFCRLLWTHREFFASIRRKLPMMTYGLIRVFTCSNQANFYMPLYRNKYKM